MIRATRHAAWVVLLLAPLIVRATSGVQEPAVPGKSDTAAAAATAQNARSSSGVTDAPGPWWSPDNFVLLSSLGVNSWRDIPQLGIWGGSFDIGMDENRQNTRSPDRSESRFSARVATEGFTLRNQGFALIDPNLLTGSAGVRFALQQSAQETDGDHSGQRGHLTGYNIDTTFLGAKPYNASLFANRSQNLTTQLSGASTHNENQNYGLIFRWREDSILRDKEILPYFSATMRARQDHTQEVTTSAGQSFRRDEQRSLFSVDAHNGFQTADLDFRFERTNLENRIYPAGSYGSQLVNVTYSLDFGPTLNRRWDSRVDYSSRSGASTMSILNLNERLNIDHFDNLSTGYNYGFTRQVTEVGNATFQNGGIQLQHRLYDNLSSSLGLSATRQVLPNGNIDGKSAQAGFNYSHGIPWSGSISASLGGSVLITNNQLQSSQVQVIDSPYQVMPTVGIGTGILLKDTFIVAESIVVVDVKGGVRLPATIGIDYLVVIEGNLTRILAQPASAVIFPGDLLEISYVRLVDPSLKFQTVSNSLLLVADWRWIAVSLSHDETVQNPLSGGDGALLSNQRRDTARLELRGNWEDYLQARGDAVVSRYNYTQLVYDELRFSQHISYRPQDNLLLSITASESRADYQVPIRHSEGREVRLDIDWANRSGWLTTAYVSRRILRDTQIPSDKVTEAAVRLNRRWSKLNVAAAVGLVERTRGGVKSNNANIHLSAIREF